MARIRELTYVVFDLEATCHPSLRYHEVIEIGAVKLAPGELKLVSTFERLVRPTTPIIRSIIDKTGITDEIVFNKPSITDVWNELDEFVGSSILVGHQVHMDVGILKRTAERENLGALQNETIDTLKLARKIYPHRVTYGLESFQKLLKLQTKAHRALSDAKVTGELLKHLIHKIEEIYSLIEFKDLWSFCYDKNFLQRKLFGI